MKHQSMISVVFVLAGAGIGFIAAKMHGISSWLDARLYMLAGVVLGAAVAELAKRVGRGDQQ